MHLTNRARAPKVPQSKPLARPWPAPNNAHVSPLVAGGHPGRPQLASSPPPPRHPVGGARCPRPTRPTTRTSGSSAGMTTATSPQPPAVATPPRTPLRTQRTTTGTGRRKGTTRNAGRTRPKPVVRATLEAGPQKHRVSPLRAVAGGANAYMYTHDANTTVHVSGVYFDRDRHCPLTVNECM